MCEKEDREEKERERERGEGGRKGVKKERGRESE